MATKLKWWGYRHVNGSVHTKRYFSQEDLDEAHESSFCEEVHGPFEAANGDEARNINFAALKRDDKKDEQINPPWIKPSFTIEQAARIAAMRNCRLTASFDKMMGVRIVAVRIEQ